MILEQKSFLASEEQQCDLDLDRSPRRKVGKRFPKIVATSNGETLFDSELKKID